MVSLVELEVGGTKAGSRSSAPTSAATEMADEMDTCASEPGDGDEAGGSSLQQDDVAARLKRLQQQKQSQGAVGRQASSDCLLGASEQEGANKSPAGAALHNDLMMDEEMDEEQLKRILACKRLSEGCNRFAGANLICRKNSLHMMMGESGLAPVTEGEPMRHMSHHMSENLESTSSSSVSSGSFRSGGGGRHLGGHMVKRSSQDDNATSCSSSTSLDGPRSPSRRRSSTVSQCSSVMSEGTRQQLNFDLSPDLPPDSSILEANTISPTDFERPASPEPSSLGSAEGSFEMRPISRMSQYCDESMLTGSPDSTLGDSNENSNPDEEDEQQQPQQQQEEEERSRASCQPAGLRGNQRAREDSEIRDNLERIITHVSTVKVTGGANQPAERLASIELAAKPISSQKRAHTPFGANLQRVKSSLISNSPSPTPQELIHNRG